MTHLKVMDFLYGFSKSTQIRNFMRIRSVSAKLLQEYRWRC